MVEKLKNVRNLYSFWRPIMGHEVENLIFLRQHIQKFFFQPLLAGLESNNDKINLMVSFRPVNT